jgi:uncharacterized membrane protein
MIKISIIIIGIILISYSSLVNRDNLLTIIGVIMILVGVMLFFFGGEAEEDIEREEE